MTSLIDRTMGKTPDPPSRAGVAGAVILVFVAVVAALAAVLPVIMMVTDALGSLEATP